MAKFKNTSDRTLSLPGFGIVAPGETVEVPHDHFFNNANFERVDAPKRKEEKSEAEKVEKKQTNES